MLDSDLRCLCAEELLRALDGGFEVLRASDGLEIAAVLIEEMLDKEVGADEVVMTCAVAHLAVERGDGRGAIDGAHVAVLAGLLLVVGAVLPLLEGDLLGEVGDGLTVGTEGVGDERMAAGTECGVADVRFLLGRKPPVEECIIVW